MLCTALGLVGVALHQLQLLVEVVERTAHSVVRVGLLLTLGRRRRALLGSLLRGHVLGALLVRVRIRLGLGLGLGLGSGLGSGLG